MNCNIILKGPKYGPQYNNEYYSIKKKSDPDIIQCFYYVKTYYDTNVIRLINSNKVYTLDVNLIKINKNKDATMSVYVSALDTYNVLQFRYNNIKFAENISLQSNILEIECKNLCIYKPNNITDFNNFKYTNGKLEIILTDKGLNKLISWG